VNQRVVASLDFEAGLTLSSHGSKTQFSNCYDARERFASEPESSYMGQIIDRCELASAVTFNGERKLKGSNARTVVTHVNYGLSAILDHDSNILGTRIQRVVEKFTDNRGWSFNNFACCYLAANV